jgi:hypothetical protein
MSSEVSIVGWVTAVKAGLNCLLLRCLVENLTPEPQMLQSRIS